VGALIGTRQIEQILRHRWAIATFLAVNLLDSLLTLVLLRMGGDEVWLMYPIALGSFDWTTVAKWSGVALVVGMLVWMNRLRWLRWFTLGMVLVVLWNLIGLLWLGFIYPAP
jgi:hypothetical protein